SQLPVRVERLYRAEKCLDLSGVVSVVVYVNHFVTLYYILKAALHPAERSKSLYNFTHLDPTKGCSNRCCECVFDVMKSGDTELNMLNLTKPVEVKFKKSSNRFDVAGKKLPPAHTVYLFRNV